MVVVGGGGVGQQIHKVKLTQSSMQHKNNKQLTKQYWPNN